MKIIKYNNNVDIYNAVRLLQKFYTACKTNDYSINTRTYYHIGMKNLLNPETEDSIVINGILTKAEGLSPRLLLMR